MKYSGLIMSWLLNVRHGFVQLKTIILYSQKLKKDDYIFLFNLVYFLF